MTLARSPLARWVVATWMAVAMPLCCCNGRYIVSTIAGVVEANLAAIGADHEPRGCCSSEPRESSDPCDDGQPCRCHQQKQLKQPESPAGADSAPAVVAPLASIAPVLPAPEPTAIAPTRAGAACGPATSLLRLHCALII